MASYDVVAKVFSLAAMELLGGCFLVKVPSPTLFSCCRSSHILKFQCFFRNVLCSRGIIDVCSAEGARRVFCQC